MVLDSLGNPGSGCDSVEPWNSLLNIKDFSVFKHCPFIISNLIYNTPHFLETHPLSPMRELTSSLLISGRKL